MFSRWQLAFKYLRYYLNASNGKGHGIHSPFVFHFIKEVLNNKTDYPEYNRVEELRKELLSDQSEIEILDLGAGSTIKKDKKTIASIVKHSAKSNKYSQLIFRIAREYKSRNILELGTSVGLTTSYLSLAAPRAMITTIEGAPAIAERARDNFDELELRNINLVPGNFDNELKSVLYNMKTVDLGFVDGNHRLEPTVRYFQTILPFTNNDSILIFDDIHWSAEMEQAWEQIRKNEKVRCSIDLFFIGIVLFREEFHEKQHFTIRF